MFFNFCRYFNTSHNEADGHGKYSLPGTFKTDPSRVLDPLDCRQSRGPPGEAPEGATRESSANPGGMHCSVAYGFIEVYVTVPDFDVEPAIRIGAYPRFVMNSSPLTSIVGKGKQLSRVTLKALGNPTVFH